LKSKKNHPKKCLKKQQELDSLLTVREAGEKFEPYHSFVALSSKKLSANKHTDGRKLQNMYLYDMNIHACRKKLD
jgi:hypothetical protein